jgi:teichoic acid transport system permease protein
MMPLDDEPAVLGAPSSRAVEDSSRRRRRRRVAEAEPRVKREAVPLGKYSDIVYVWEPHRPELPPLRPYLDSLWARRHLMKAMSDADLRSRESRTFLGRIWWLIDPLIQAAIFYMVFSMIRGGPHSTDILPRLVTSIFLFNLAGVALGEGGASIRQNRGLLLNSDFPRAMLPLTVIYKGLARFWPSIPVAVFVCIAFDAPIGPSVVLLPVLFAFQIVMMVGIALLCSASTVLIPDSQNIINYISRILFFATPIIWTITSVGDNLKTVLAFQPFFALFASYQTIIETGSWPSLKMLAPIPVWTVFMFVVGSWVFLRREREFAVRL